MADGRAASPLNQREEASGDGRARCAPSCIGPDDKGSWKSACYAGWSRRKDKYDASDDGNEAPGAETGWTWVRGSIQDAYGSWQERLDKVPRRRWRDFSWLAATPLLDSANDQVAKIVHDLVNDRRQRWIAAQRAARAHERWPDFVVSLEDKKSFLILGDPGEVDPSQYAVVEPMLAVHKQRKSDFMLILSDVVYAAGDINDYVNAFYIPYMEYDRPIFALPGNHDWYDGLNGFMFHFCGAEPLPDVKFRSSTYTGPERLARWLWRGGARPYRPRLLQYRYDQARFRKDKAWKPAQPAPYFAIDLGRDLRLVSIDTGIRGTIDREQGEWLVRVSRDPNRVKILLTGKPLWVDGAYHPCPIEWGREREYPNGYETVDDVVRDPANGYVGSIGGDIHNYQRYCVRLTNERKETERALEYIVAGGGGAYMAATHKFGKVDNHARESLACRTRRIQQQEAGKREPPRRIDPPETVAPVTEADFRSYPSRGDSLAYYARSYGRRVANLGWTLLAATFAILALVFGILDGADTKIGHQDVLNVFWVLPATLAVILVVVGAMAALDRLAPRHFKFPVVVLATPLLALLVVTLVRVAAGDQTWPWAWKAGLLSLGTILLPLAIILGLYYGLGSTGRPSSELVVPRTLALGFLTVAEIAIWIHWGRYDSASALAVAISLALAAVALLVLVVSITNNVRSTIFKFFASRWWLNVIATVFVYGLFVGNVIWRYRHAWAIDVTLVAAGSLWVLATVVYWILMLPRGVGALIGGLWRGRLDPAVAMWWLRKNGYANQSAARRIAAQDPSKPKQWLCAYLMSRLGRLGVSEVGNADSPPLFKSFLHLEVREEGGARKLEISCYGVTGWKAHEDMEGEHVVPLEDCIQINLTAARDELRGTLRKREDRAAAPEIGAVPGTLT
jgi:hypothetical protein